MSVKEIILLWVEGSKIFTRKPVDDYKDSLMVPINETLLTTKVTVWGISISS